MIFIIAWTALILGAIMNNFCLEVESEDNKII